MIARISRLMKPPLCLVAMYNLNDFSDRPHTSLIAENSVTPGFNDESPERSLVHSTTVRLKKKLGNGRTLNDASFKIKCRRSTLLMQPWSLFRIENDILRWETLPYVCRFEF